MDGGGGVLKVQGGRVSGGVTFHTDWMPGKGIGVNDRGDIGVATGDAKDSMKVNSPGDAKAGAVGGGKSGAPRASTRSTKIIASRATIRTAAQPRPPSPDQRPRARRRTSRS